MALPEGVPEIVGMAFVAGGFCDDGGPGGGADASGVLEEPPPHAAMPNAIATITSPARQLAFAISAFSSKTPWPGRQR